ncbi:MAG: VWA domain-containing protein [Isosphaeraceae bacterium]
MSFGAPLFLLAVLAGLIPVAVHLIHRRRAKEIRFSTLRFLKLSVQRTRRRKYLEDLSLLALRAAVLVLIAIGLARPAINSVSALWGSGRSAAVAIVLDNSASMGTIDGGRPRFETARQAAEQILSGLREGDQAALLLTGGPPAPELGRLFRTLATVRQALDQCRVSAERADLAARLQQARDLLAQADSANREIYIVTDNQSLSWDGLKEGGATGSAPGIPVVLVGVDREPAPNVALQSLRLDTPAPVAGAPFLAEVDVRNTSIVPQQKHLELQVDGARRAVSPTLSLPPGGSVKHLFRFTLDRGGVHRGEVRLVEDDGLPLDNRLFFAAGVDQQVPVAILKPRRTRSPRRTTPSTWSVPWPPAGRSARPSG